MMQERPIRLATEDLTASKELRAAMDAREACRDLRFTWKKHTFQDITFLEIEGVEYSCCVTATSAQVWRGTDPLLEKEFPRMSTGCESLRPLLRSLCEIYVRHCAYAVAERRVQDLIECQN